jgi:glutathione S-transferase
MTLIFQHSLWIFIAFCAVLFVWQMIKAQGEINQKRLATAEKAAKFRNRCGRELSLLQAELSQIDSGQTLISGDRPGRRVWVSGYRGNLRLHWRSYGNTYDQQLPIGYDVIKEARVKLGLVH